MTKLFRIIFFVGLILTGIVACSSPEEKAQNFYEKGMALLEQGELKKAKLELRNALQIKKNMADAWYGLALIAEKEEKWKQYYNLLTQVISLDKQHYDAKLKLARLYLVANELPEALRIAEELEKTYPEKSEVLSLVANVQQQLKNYDNAVQYAEMALENDSNNTHAYYVLASERIAQNDLNSATKFIESGLAINKDELSLLALKTKISQANKDVPVLIQTLKKMVELQPESMEFRKGLLTALVATGKHAEAETFLRDRYAENPDDKDALNELISFVYQAYGTESAIGEIEKMIQEQPSNINLKFTLIDLYIKEQQYAKASEKLNRLSQDTQLLETRIRAKERLAQIAIKNNDKTTSFQLIDEILSEDPTNVQGLLWRATDQIAKGEINDAISNLRSVLRESPDSAPALRLLGIAHDSSGDKVLAEDYLSRAFTASNFSPEYALFYAKYLMKLDRNERAISVLTKAIESSEDNAMLLNQLANLYILNKDWINAQKITDRISQLGKGNELSFQLQGVISAAQKDYQTSIESFTKSYQAFPNETQPLAMLIKTYVDARRFSEAEQFLEKVLETNPDNETALILKARLYSIQLKVPDAANLYSSLISKHPGHAQFYIEYVKLYLGAKDPKKAVKVLDKGIKNVPDNVELRLLKASFNKGQKDFDGAIKQYEKIIDIEPNHLIARNNLANLLVDHKQDQANVDRAVELVQLLKNSENPFILDTVGWVYYKDNQFEMANDFLQRAAKKASGHILIRFHLALNYEALNQNENANKEYNAILEIAGGRDFPLRTKVEEGLERTSMGYAAGISLEAVGN